MRYYRIMRAPDNKWRLLSYVAGHEYDIKLDFDTEKEAVDEMLILKLSL